MTGDRGLAEDIPYHTNRATGDRGLAEDIPYHTNRATVDGCNAGNCCLVDT